MTDNRNEFESRINALLDGELDPDSAKELKRAAEDDRDLARAIVEAYQLQQAMEGLGVEHAPASLRRKLRAIPRQERPAWWRQPAFLAAAASVPVVVLSIALLQPRPPSDAELQNAWQEAQLAFSIIEDARQRAGASVRSRVSKEIDGAVNDPIRDSLPFVNTDPKEKTS